MFNLFIHFLVIAEVSIKIIKSSLASLDEASVDTCHPLVEASGATAAPIVGFLAHFDASLVERLTVLAVVLAHCTLLSAVRVGKDGVIQRFAQRD